MSIEYTMESETDECLRCGETVDEETYRYHDKCPVVCGHCWLELEGQMTLPCGKPRLGQWLKFLPTFMNGIEYEA